MTVAATETALPPSPVPTPVTSSPPLSPTTDPPPGLIYRTSDALWKVGVSTVGLVTQPFNRPDALISPDGNYALYWDWESNDLWWADLTTRERRNLTNDYDHIECCFRWWPERPDIVVFSSRPPEVEPGPGMTGFLAVANVDGSGYHVLDDQHHTGGSPALSPDGQTIAYGGGNIGWLYHLETGKTQAFNPADYGVTDIKGGLGIGSPAWSPDGTKMAWMVGGGGMTVNGEQLAAEGNSLMGVAVFDLEAGSARILHAYETPGGDGWPSAPKWSADGHWVAFTAWGQNERGVWVAQADGQHKQQVGSEFSGNPVWSPDGAWLVYSQNTGDQTSSVWMVEIGMELQQQIDLPLDAAVVDWVSVLE